jgi:hypothetical protein
MAQTKVCEVVTQIAESKSHNTVVDIAQKLVGAALAAERFVVVHQEKLLFVSYVHTFC